jgi:hypothetical protein
MASRGEPTQPIPPDGVYQVTKVSHRRPAVEGDLLRPVVMVLVILLFAVVGKGIMDHLSRKQLISKGLSPDELVPRSLRDGGLQLLSAIKWALLCLGVGAALLLPELLPNTLSATAVFGLTFIGAGLGFLVYALIAKRMIGHRPPDDRANSG